MFLNQVYLLIVLDSLCFLAHTALAEEDDEEENNIRGEGISCSITNYPYFVVIYTKTEACGGALISLQLAVVGGICLADRLGGTSSQKWVRAGSNPYFQHRAVRKTSTCYTKVNCNFAIVEVKSQFKRSEFVNVARAATEKSIFKCEEGTYLYTTYKKPWDRKKALNLICVKIGLSKCIDSEDICADKHEEEDQYDDGDDYNQREAGMVIDHDYEYHSTADSDDYKITYKNENTALKEDDDDDGGDYDDNGDENKGICNDNSGGPLMCGSCVLGFLLGSSCQNQKGRDENNNKFRFTNMQKQTDQFLILLGKNARSILGNATGDGRSLQKLDDFHTKFLSVGLTAALFIFVY